MFTLTCFIVFNSIVGGQNYGTAIPIDKITRVVRDTYNGQTYIYQSPTNAAFPVAMTFDDTMKAISDTQNNCLASQKK